MPAPDNIRQLVEGFEQQRKAFRSGRYNEAQLRHDKMMSLVERMFELHKRSPKTPQEQNMVNGEIESVDVDG